MLVKYSDIIDSSVAYPYHDYFNATTFQYYISKSGSLLRCMLLLVIIYSAWNVQKQIYSIGRIVLGIKSLKAQKYRCRWYNIVCRIKNTS